MSRQDTLAQARADRQARLDRDTQTGQRRAPSQPRDYYASNAPVAPQPAPQPRRGYSGAQLAGAAAAGAVAGGLVGYAAGTDSHPQPATPVHPYPTPTHDQYDNQARVTSVPPSNYGGQDEYRPAAALAPSAGAKGGEGPSGLGIVLILLLVGLGAYGVLRLLRSQRASDGNQFTAAVAAGEGHGIPRSDYSHTATPTPSSSAVHKAPSRGTVLPAESQRASDELLGLAEPLFRDLQKAQSNGDAKKARQLADGQVLSDVEAAIREGSTPVQVHAVEIEGDCVRDFVSDNGYYVASIYFVAEISEDGGEIEAIEELWNFRRPIAGGDWKVVGIDQV